MCFFSLTPSILQNLLISKLSKKDNEQIKLTANNWEKAFKAKMGKDFDRFGNDENKQIIMGKNKFLILFLIICLLTNCKSSSNGKLVIEVKELNLIFTKPDILSDRDSMANFETYIFFEARCLVKNGAGIEKEILLNNLMSKDYSFDISLHFIDKDIFFYNYPFSASLYPIRNRQVIKGYDSILISLQTPLAFSLKEANMAKVDSVLQLVKKSKFNLIINQNGKADYILNNNEIAYGLVPISDKCFLPRPL